MVGYMDGYFLLNEKDTPKIWFSNLFNGLTWSATDFFTRSSTSDNVTGFAVNNRRVYVIGSKSTEIFQNSGDPTTPFIPYPGTVINEGSRGYANIASIADTVFWIGSSLEYGYSQIFAVSGLQPKLISTPPISASIGGNADSAAEALAYSQGGHDFVCWTFPFIKTTWCYDLTEEAWHARAKVVESPPGVYTQSIWPARGCCTWLPILGEPFARVIVGHWFDGVFADLSLDTYTEPASATTGDIYPIFRQRVAPYLSAENQWLFLQQMELGINAQAGALPSPDVQLRLSGDNGTSFGPPMPASALAQDGQAVAQWFQLGRYRADRLVIAVQSQVDRPTVWGPGLFLRATPGTGQL
jgi:hypothetical protein